MLCDVTCTTSSIHAMNEQVMMLLSLVVVYLQTVIACF